MELTCLVGLVVLGVSVVVVVVVVVVRLVAVSVVGVGVLGDLEVGLLDVLIWLRLGVVRFDGEPDLVHCCVSVGDRDGDDNCGCSVLLSGSDIDKH